jgi:hypothetical protein
MEKEIKEINETIDELFEEIVIDYKKIIKSISIATFQHIADMSLESGMTLELLRGEIYKTIKKIE